MSDIVERLRAFAKKWGAAEGDQHGELALANEAAQAIEELRREQHGLYSAVADHSVEHDKWRARALAAEAEVTRLRDALKPFAADRLPSTTRTERDYDENGLRRMMSPMEIARKRARASLQGKGGTA